MSRIIFLRNFLLMKVEKRTKLVTMVRRVSQAQRLLEAALQVSINVMRSRI
jgi:hypothetical protein